MLPNRTAIALCALSLCALALPSAAEAALVTHFNFNLDSGGNGYDGGVGPIDAANGNGTMLFSGIPDNELTSVQGTTENAVVGDAAGNAVSIRNNGGNPTNLTIQFSSQGHDNLALSFAAKASAASYTQIGVQYSINGTNFSPEFPVITFDPASSGNWTTTGPIDLSSMTELNNLANVYLRLVLTGSNMMSTPQTLEIDNLQINGTSVPEAPAVAMMLMALLLFGGMAYRRRRAAAGQSVPAQVLAA